MVDSYLKPLIRRYRECLARTFALKLFCAPQIMRRDSQFVHAEITENAARLLTAPGFEGPDQEFLNAHKSYLKGNTKEAIRETLNTFESTLKVICTQRKWKFDPQ